MANALAVGISLGIVAITAVFIVPQLIQSRYRNSPAGIEMARVEATKASLRVETEARVTTLAADGCKDRVSELAKLHTAHPTMTEGDVPTSLEEDLRLCLRRKIIRLYALDELRDKGLLPLITD